MSPNLGSCWTTWGTVSSGFREIEIGWNRLESVGHVAPFVAPADPPPFASIDLLGTSLAWPEPNMVCKEWAHSHLSRRVVPAMQWPWQQE
jgi:hypothetical protein